MNAPLPTRIFKSGNSLAVRIPKELVSSDLPLDAEISLNNGVFTVRPLQKRKLTDLAAKFAAFSPGFMSQGRFVEEESERDWGAASIGAGAAQNPDARKVQGGS